MRCPQCKCLNPPDGNFCNTCGFSLHSPPAAKTSGLSANDKLDILQRYLPRGATKRILKHRNKLEGERRQATVMFCDMEGFTQLAAGLDSEVTYRMMDRVYEMLIHCVHEFKGTVNEMTGDGIMALFGAPIAIEDAPQRAIRAAVAIHQKMACYNSTNIRPGTIRMRIGINTGPVIVGALGNNLRVEFKAVGDTVNLASRLEALAEPGSTYVAEATYKQTRNLFDYKHVGKKFVKGQQHSIAIYKVMAAKQDVYRPRLGAERMIYARHAGRDKELKVLESQLEQAIEGKGSIVNIIGEAGIGKSRLVAELKNRNLAKRFSCFEGRAIEIGRNLALHPVIELLNQLAGIHRVDEDQVASGKLASVLRKLFPDEYQSRLPVMASLMGIDSGEQFAHVLEGIEGEPLEKLILANVSELLARSSQLRPLLVIIEDLHWADTTSVELLEAVYYLAQNEKIVFINVFRPNYKDTGERIRQYLHAHLLECYSEIQLVPLDKRTCESIIASMLGMTRLDSGISDQIINRAGGNPYFIEEIVRSMIDEGALMFSNGRFCPTKKIRSVIIPNSINDVIMSRIDQLEETTRDLVMVAAVVGRTFLGPIVQAVAEDIDDVDQRLSLLGDMQLIIESLKNSGQVEYRFKHGLAQETVYFSMLPEKRRWLHLKVAHVIETLFQERLHEFYGILSYHFNQGADFERAKRYMTAAGHEAMKISASNEALHYYKSALDLYIRNYSDAVDEIKIAELEENIAIAFFNKGNFAEAALYFEKALRKYGVKRTNNWALLAMEVTISLLKIIRYLYIPAFAPKLAPSKTDMRLMNLKFKLAMSLSYLNINRVFIDNISNVPASFKRDIRNAPVYVDALIGLSALFAVTGISFHLSQRILRYVERNVFRDDAALSVPKNFFRFIEALHNCLTGKWHHKVNEDYIEDALKVGDISYVSGYLFWLGYASLEHGDLEEAANVIHRQNEIANRYNFVNARIDSCFLSAKLDMVNQNLSRAETHIEKGIELTQKYKMDIRKVGFCGLKIKLLTLQNDVASARTIVRESDDLIMIIGERAILPDSYGEYLIGKLGLFVSQLEAIQNVDRQADDTYIGDMALTVAKKNMKFFRKRTAVGRTEAYRLIGTYYWLVGSKSNAFTWWKKSRQEGKRLSAELELSKTLEEMALRRTKNL